MSSAFVIQIHSGYGAPHYDLMLECGSALATWRLERPPGDLAAGQGAAARKLGDHRREYLTYEGPVSGGRGEVKVLDRGEYELKGGSEDCWQFELRGKAAAGAFTLRRRQGDDWTLTRS